MYISNILYLQNLLKKRVIVRKLIIFKNMDKLPHLQLKDIIKNEYKKTVINRHGVTLPTLF